MVFRWALCSLIFHGACAVAGYKTLKSPAERSHLVMWCLLAFMECITHIPPVSTILTNFMPFFWELRALIGCLIIYMPPNALDRTFNAVFLPILGTIVNIDTVTPTSKLAKWGVRKLLHLLLLLLPLCNLDMNHHMQYKGAVKKLGQVVEPVQTTSRVEELQ